MAMMGKLAIIACFCSFAIFLGGGMVTLKFFISRGRRKRGLSTRNHKLSPKSLSLADQEASSTEASLSTTTENKTSASEPTSEARLSVRRKFGQIPQMGSSWKGSGEAYWTHVLSFLDWDAFQSGDDMGGSLNFDAGSFAKVTSKKSGASPRVALQFAAKAGHPVAQHYMANALASGVWPVPAGTEQSLEGTSLTVVDEMIPDSSSSTALDGNLQLVQLQLARSRLYWQMAATAGNLESTMALAHRLDSGSRSTKEIALSSCQDALVYYQAAANGIMDDLESSLHSRAKSLPPQDKHYLAEVHIHGGSSSRLDLHNRPDESKEALQFYHLKATTWQSIDVDVAFRLAQLYHHGIRGVPQNLTLALNYYQIAATHGHWESAGHAGMFHVYGMGTDQNLETAFKFFEVGAPFGLDGCRRRHDQSLRFSQQKKKQGRVQRDEDVEDGDEYKESVVTCDSRSVNGMGVLYLFGIPDMIGVDLVQAEKYFMLAKEMGNADAHYNLGMMWLGWKTHYKRVEDLEDGGSSSWGASTGFSNGKVISSSFALHVARRPEKQLFEGPTQKEYNEAIKLLVFAANKGHLQARHRLGMIHSDGIKLHGSALDYDAIKPDCLKAKIQFQWIVENASPQRSKRLRIAYKQYIAGNLRASLRNYLAAGEAGSLVGQANAAFLLERGECLGLSPEDCARASVRLWKAAAAKGNPEACLRVGDFYYFGRVRRASSTDYYSRSLPLFGPFGWAQVVVYPEEYVFQLFRAFKKNLIAWITPWMNREIDETRYSVCKGIGGVIDSHNCPAWDGRADLEIGRLEADLELAAHYYQIAVEKHHSPRANFNLGFMHEWGLGLTQDFPLAKRHYDLAATVNSNEAELVVQIALAALACHEQMVKLHLCWEDWTKLGMQLLGTYLSSGPADARTEGSSMPTTISEVILFHMVSWEFLVVVLLTVVLSRIAQLRLGQQH